MNSKKHFHSGHVVDKEKGCFTDSKKQPDSDGVIDMELRCISCGMQLYVPDMSIDSILTSLEQTGVAILICMCGQAQTIRWKSQHRWHC